MDAREVSKAPGVIVFDEDGSANFVASKLSSITVPYSASNNAPTFSVEVWVRPTSLAQDGEYVPFVRSIGPGSSSGYSLGIETSEHKWIFGIGEVGETGLTKHVVGMSGRSPLLWSVFETLFSSQNRALLASTDTPPCNLNAHTP